MLAVVKWYIASFVYGTHNALTKKPYNPFLGEIFRCHWSTTPTNHEVPSKLNNVQKRVSFEDGGRPTTNSSESTDEHWLSFVAEQVSHHPPVSAFYAATPAEDLAINGCVWPRSKFMGMSIQCQMVGECLLMVRPKVPSSTTTTTTSTSKQQYQHESLQEVYRCTLPSVHGRAILTSTPWLELTGRTEVSCAESGLSAGITFHAKPFYGGRIHKVSAEIRQSSGALVARVQGEWNRSLELQWYSPTTGEPVSPPATSRGGQQAGGGGKVVEGKLVMDIPGDFPRGTRLIRPQGSQHPRESRRVWAPVTKALRSENLEAAARYKKALEDRQRYEMTKLRGPSSPSLASEDSTTPEAGPTGQYVSHYFEPAPVRRNDNPDDPDTNTRLTGWIYSKMPSLGD